MPMLLIALSSVLTFMLCWSMEPAIVGHTRTALLKAAILQGVTIVTLTELLSLFHALTLLAVSLFWAGCILVQGGVLLVGWQGRSSRLTFRSTTCLSSTLLQPENRLVAIALTFILAITLITALLAPPNNWDGMVYHLPRVMQWLQNQSVTHYPTSELRQLAFMPGAGYMVAQLRLLAGDDRWVNVVQWLAFVGCIGGISLITRLLSGKTAEWLGALVCASLPMAILQSMTCQTDLLTAFWLVCLTYFALQPITALSAPRSFKNPRRKPIGFFFYRPEDGWMAAALGLGIVTKPTAWIFGFALLVLAVVVRSEYWRQTVRLPPWKALGRSTIVIASLGFTSLSLALPSFWRNYQTFGSWLGAGENTRNTLLDWSTLLSNLFKNLALSLPIPGIWPLIGYLHQHWLHLSPDDPRLSFTATPLTDPAFSPMEALLKVVAPHEDFVGYPIHLVLGMLAIVFLLRSLPQYLTKPRYPLLALVLVVFVNGLLFCLLLKWQPWGNRLLLPLAVLATPIITEYLVQGLPKWGRSRVLAGLALMAIAYTLTPLRHPLISLPTGSKEQSASILTLPRQDLYFSGARKELAIPYQQAVQQISKSGCSRVGLVLAGESWEYPLWVKLQQQELRDLRIRHVWVQNSSQTSLPVFPEQALCAILSTKSRFSGPDGLFPGQPWRSSLISTDPFVQVFLNDDRQSQKTTSH